MVIPGVGVLYSLWKENRAFKNCMDAIAEVLNFGYPICLQMNSVDPDQTAPLIWRLSRPVCLKLRIISVSLLFKETQNKQKIQLLEQILSKRYLSKYKKLFFILLKLTCDNFPYKLPLYTPWCRNYPPFYPILSLYHIILWKLLKADSSFT